MIWGQLPWGVAGVRGTVDEEKQVACGLFNTRSEYYGHASCHNIYGQVDEERRMP